MILVTGASGQAGCAVIRGLHRLGLPVRAFIHREENRAKVLDAGAREVYVGDMNHIRDLREAFRGVDTVYYICSAQNPAEDEIGRKMMDIAAAQGDIYFVYHSVLHPLLEEMPHHKKKQNVERMLVESGLTFSIVRPSVFMQMLMPGALSAKNGGPAPQKFFRDGEHRMNFIDIQDFAEAAARIISNRAYAWGTYELAGPENISRGDLEAALSRAVGREVKTVFLEDGIFLSRVNIPPESYRGKTMLTMFSHYNTHSFPGNCKTFEMITGRKPRTLFDSICSWL